MLRRDYVSESRLKDLERLMIQSNDPENRINGIVSEEEFRKGISEGNDSISLRLPIYRGAAIELLQDGFHQLLTLKRLIPAQTDHWWWVVDVYSDGKISHALQLTVRIIAAGKGLSPI
jgi:hypothetical protein